MVTNNSSGLYKARTILVSTGKRINWTRIPYFTYQDIKDTDNYLVSVKWKYKASIRVEEFPLSKDKFKSNNYFKQYGLVKLSSNIYINLNRIMFIEETQPSLDSVIVRFVLIDGFEFHQKFKLQNWIWWRDNYT